MIEYSSARTVRDIRTSGIVRVASGAVAPRTDVTTSGDDDDEDDDSGGGYKDDGRDD